jgi:hypothetical protein
LKNRQNVQTDMQHMGDVVQHRDVPQVAGVEIEAAPEETADHQQENEDADGFVGRNGEAFKSAGWQKRQEAATCEHANHQRSDEPVQQACNQAIPVLGYS